MLSDRAENYNEALCCWLEHEKKIRAIISAGDGAAAH